MLFIRSMSRCSVIFKLPAYVAFLVSFMKFHKFHWSNGCISYDRLSIVSIVEPTPPYEELSLLRCINCALFIFDICI